MSAHNTSQCGLYNKNNHSSPIYIKNSYGGIPQNLLTNTIGFVFLAFLFLLLRKSAWRVVNKIVKKDGIERWYHLFFAQISSLAANSSFPDSMKQRRGSHLQAAKLGNGIPTDMHQADTIPEELE